MANIIMQYIMKPPAPRPTPARQHALHWLTDWLAAHPAQPLPTITAMANAAGVSRVTMWQALQASPARPRPSGRTHVVQQQILADINADAFGRGTRLPSIKQLAAHYGASNTIVVSALRTLVARGVLEYRAHGYRVRGGTNARRVQHTVLCLTSMGETTRFSRTTPRAADFWRAVERECLRRTVSFVTHAIWDYGEIGQDGAGPPPSLRAAVAHPSILGVLYWALDARPALMKRVLAPVLTTSVPVSVLHEGREEDARAMEGDARRAPRLRMFTLGEGARCGVEVGRYLHASGHRNVAFMASVADDTRAKGVAQAYLDVGLPDAVRRFAPATLMVDSDLYATLAATQPYKRLGSQMQSLRERLLAVAGTTVASYLPASDPLLVAFLRDALRPQFEEALRDRAITAWVGSTDLIAFLAMDFLRERGIDVPAQVSVVGFDDSIESFDRGLTSYSFNAPACAVAIMDHLVSPTRYRQLNPDPIIEVPGMVIPRRTTRNLPARSDHHRA